MKNPAEDIVTVLVTAGLGVVGQTLFHGPPSEVKEPPPVETFVFTTGGVQTPYMGSGDSLKKPRLRAQIRAQNYADGYEQAQLVATAIHTNDPPEMGYAGWTTDLPIPMKRDEKGRFRWSVPILVQYTE